MKCTNKTNALAVLFLLIFILPHFLESQTRDKGKKLIWLNFTLLKDKPYDADLIRKLPGEVPKAIALGLAWCDGIVVVERDSCEKVLKNLKSQKDDSFNFNRETLVEIGKKTGADLALIGKIDISDGEVVINAEIADMKTGLNKVPMKTCFLELARLYDEGIVTIIGNRLARELTETDLAQLDDIIQDIREPAVKEPKKSRPSMDPSLLDILLSDSTGPTGEEPKKSLPPEEGISEESGGLSGTESEEYVKFPWPPPKASALMVISPGLLIKSAEKGIRLSHIERRLKAALDSCGYSQVSYFAVPDGFAMVTHIEQINPDGTPKDGPARWTTDAATTEKFSLMNYIRALFSANKGTFRIIVFIATPHPFTQSAAAVKYEEAMEWLNKGYNVLPPGIGNLAYTDEYACTALIYEFQHPDTQKEAVQKIPGLQAKVHLEKSKILYVLRRQP